MMLQLFCPRETFHPASLYQTHMMLHEGLVVIQDKGHEEKEKEGRMQFSKH